MPKLYTTEEVADVLKVSEQIVRRHIKEGRLTANKPGGGRGWRVTEEALNDFLRRSTQDEPEASTDANG